MRQIKAVRKACVAHINWWWQHTGLPLLAQRLIDDGNMQGCHRWPSNYGPQLGHLPFRRWPNVGCTWWGRYVGLCWPGAGPAWHADWVYNVYNWSSVSVVNHECQINNSYFNLLSLVSIPLADQTSWRCCVQEQGWPSFRHNYHQSVCCSTWYGKCNSVYVRCSTK